MEINRNRISIQLIYYLIFSVNTFLAVKPQNSFASGKINKNIYFVLLCVF